MLGTMLAALHANMAAVGLAELTQGLRACFKVLGRIQMPVGYMDLEAAGLDPLVQEFSGEPAQVSRPPVPRSRAERFGEIIKLRLFRPILGFSMQLIL